MAEQFEIMRFGILPFRYLQEFENQVSKKHIVIGYRTPAVKYPEIKYSQNCVDHMEVGVHDIHLQDIDAWNQRGGVVFTNQNAQEIINFVEKNRNKMNLVVCQCDAGISRSSATAAALSFIYNGDDSWVFDNRKYSPNELIYNTILAKVGISDEI